MKPLKLQRSRTDIYLATMCLSSVLSLGPIHFRLLVRLSRSVLRSGAILAALCLSANNPGANPTALPQIGEHGLQILAPSLLELSLVTTKDRDVPPAQWNFVGANFSPVLPSPGEFEVRVGGTVISVAEVGFKRRPLYAPLRTRDLRIGNSLYLKLNGAIPEGAMVTVRNPSGTLWNEAVTTFTAEAAPLRFNPALHVNQVGYLPNFAKKAMVGYYLGSLGELAIPSGIFHLVDARTGTVAFTGSLRNRKDAGYTYSPAPYQNVYEADFSAFTTPGEYRLQVPGMGVSHPFLINEGTAAAFARTLVLGLYHQRCGGKNEYPFTRHEHGVCHAAPAEVPTLAYTAVNNVLATESANYADSPRHTAPQLKNVAASLYPFVNTGPLDVSGGHHDAGDYSKYTINSAGLIHHLVFAADAFPGVAALDNLGIPESGDGRSDLLQEAKWEADFLAKMQDADGGFYFLVYPRDRRYEDDVLPDHGDSQVVFPKTTAVTAAATAALAEIASSPVFKEQFPQEAAAYLAKALRGWEFLTRAINTYGKDGSYQKITHYGNEFMHDDELAWAAAALFAATGDPAFQAQLQAWYNPADPNTRRWSWWRLFEAYGSAARTYAFAVRTGRLPAGSLNSEYLAQCENEIIAAGDDIARFSQMSAYGTSFPDLNKLYRSAGWFFSTERAFELAVADQLRPASEYVEALLGNINYEGGCNPVNMPYITGLGWQRWRDIVHQYAQNDHRVLPPSGLPLGNIQAGFAYLENYKQELGQLCFPPDGAGTAPYPFYDRFGDSFNTTTEFVVVDQARSVASLAYLMAKTATAQSAYTRPSAAISGLPAVVPAEQTITATFEAPGVDLTGARILWEARDQQPYIGPAFTFAAKNAGEQWVEVEALLPDGRRLVARANFTASSSLTIPPNSFQSAPVTAEAGVVALYHLDDALNDATAQAGLLTLSGQARLDGMNLAWMAARSGQALRFDDLGDKATVSIPAAALYNNATTELSVEAMVFVESYQGWNNGTAKLLSLERSWNASLKWFEDMYAGPNVSGGTSFSVDAAALASALPPGQWHHLRIGLSSAGYSLRVNGLLVASQPSADLSGWNGGSAVLELGNFSGWMDEVVIRNNGAPQVESPVVLDADNDGLPDTFELIHGLNPNDATDAGLDLDGDGLSGLQEFLTGSDPANASSGLRILTAEELATSFRVRFCSAPDNAYTLEANDNFPADAWKTIATVLQSTGSEFSSIDSEASLHSTRMYRIKAATAGGQSVCSEPAGFYRLNCRGNADTMLSLPLARPSAALGALRSISGNTIQLRSNPGWTANQWVYAAGTQSNTYYVIFRSGALEGRYFTVNANNADTLTLDLQGGSLDGLVAGDHLALIPYWTLATAFPSGKGVHSSSSPTDRRTELLFPNVGGTGINLSTARTYYLYNGAWRQVGQGSAIKNDDVILPDMYIWVRHNIATPTTVTASGSVLRGQWRFDIRRQEKQRQDNIAALPRPFGISLGQAGLLESGFRSSPSSSSRLDELLVFDNAAGLKNKSACATYYHYNGAWRKVGAGSTVMDAEMVFAPGGGVVIRACPEAAIPPAPAPEPGSSPATAARYLGLNSSVMGSWKGPFGRDGYQIVYDGSSLPSYATVSASGKSDHVWNWSTTEAAALEKSASTDRLAACWYAASAFEVQVAIQDGQTHKVSFYCVDWDLAGRTQSVEVLDTATGTVLHQASLAAFQKGAYLSYDVKGAVTFRFTRTGPNNAVVSAIFFDPASAPL